MRVSMLIASDGILTPELALSSLANGRCASSRLLFAVLALIRIIRRLRE